MRKLSRHESIFKCVCCKTAIKKMSEHNFIYDEDGNCKDIHQILVACIGTKPQVSNNLNQAVCTPCSVQLQQSYMFKQMCLKTEVEDGLTDEETLKHEHVTLVDAGPGVDIKLEEYITDVDHLKIKSEIEDIATLMNAVEDDFHNAFEENQQLVSEVHVGQRTSLGCEQIGFAESNAKYLEESVFGLADSQPLDTQLGDYRTINSYKQNVNQLAPSYLSCNIKREAAEPDFTSLDNENDMDAFKIPKIEIWDVCEDVECPADEKPVDIDSYLLSISTKLLNDSISNAVMCIICKEYKLESFSGLVQHVVIEHNKMGELICCLCSNPFKDVSDFKDHLFIVHGDLVQPIKILTCQTCDCMFSSVVKFGKHSCKQKDITLPLDANYTCSTCDKQLISKNRYVFHQQFHLSLPRPKVCLVCRISFVDEHKFYEHVHFSHEPFPQHFCMYCDKSFTTEWEWKRHVHCPKCDKTFVLRKSLQNHVNRFHVNGKQPKSKRRSASAVTSDESRKSFNFQKFVVQKADGLWYCRECDRQYSSRHNAEIHVQTVHWKVKNFHCTVCNKGYFLRRDYDNHMKIHTSDVHYECSYCAYKTRKKSMLQSHIRSHANGLNVRVAAKRTVNPPTKQPPAKRQNTTTTKSPPTVEAIKLSPIYGVRAPASPPTVEAIRLTPIYDVSPPPSPPTVEAIILSPLYDASPRPASPPTVEAIRLTPIYDVSPPPSPPTVEAIILSPFYDASPRPASPPTVEAIILSPPSPVKVQVLRQKSSLQKQQPLRTGMRSASQPKILKTQARVKILNKEAPTKKVQIRQVITDESGVTFQLTEVLKEQPKHHRRSTTKHSATQPKILNAQVKILNKEAPSNKVQSISASHTPVRRY